MTKAEIWLCKFFLPEFIARRAQGPVIRSGEEAEKENCFAIFINRDKKPFLLIERMDGQTLYGKRWASNSFSVDSTIELEKVDQNDLMVKHYWGVIDIRYNGVWDMAFTRILPYTYAKGAVYVWWDSLLQRIFNKRSLRAIERARLLHFLVDSHIEKGGGALSSIDVLTGLHSLRWVAHPDANAEQRKVELYLEAFVHSGDLVKQGHRYAVTGAAISTIERLESEERRHTDNLRVQVGMLILYVVIGFFSAVQAGLVKLPILIDWSQKITTK